MVEVGEGGERHLGPEEMPLQVVEGWGREERKLELRLLQEKEAVTRGMEERFPLAGPSLWSPPRRPQGLPSPPRTVALGRRARPSVLVTQVSRMSLDSLDSVTSSNSV